MPRAVDVITHEHRSITAVISALEYLARDVAGGGEPDYEVLTVILDYIETFPNRLHHPKEDRYLFSALRLRSPAAAPILDELEEEHRRGDDPVPGLAPRQEFDALFRLIVAMAPPPIGLGPTAAERGQG
jgi:hemerythrin-like domain-containing protein